ncbi:tripartite tricarboxylate transporter TctB family protein [uncultured Serinicoccus sp.]|uniref:tripartite tricarboxylate transporter TctB family protein n=1 Tax=uncultured Serinicoccus sp. TaxID=735514 RepID=UPI002608E25F|nr:tripartite tricarboxylate transporter TctB family protein [uncultured Serinicoccus sp.]
MPKGMPPQTDSPAGPDVGAQVSDRIIGILLMAIAVAAVVEALRLGLGTVERPGPGGWIMNGGLLLMVLSILIIWRPRRSEPFAEGGVKRVVMLIVWICLYIIALRPLGFILASSLFGMGAVWISQERRVIPLVLVPVGVTVFIYLLFTQVLSVRLP